MRAQRLATRPSAASVLETVDAVRRSWWAAVAGVCLGLASALVVLHHVPRTYEGAARIRMPAASVAAGLDPAELREAVLGSSNLRRAVADSFGAAPDGQRLEPLVERAGVEVRGRWLIVSFRDEDPERAAAVANRLAWLHVAGATAPPPGMRGTPRAPHSIEAAVPPGLPVRPRPLPVAALFVGFGLALFVGPVAAKTLSTPVVRSAAGLRQVSDLPLLVSIPRIPTAESGRLERERRLRNLRWSALSLMVLVVALLRYW